jgi:hypothetical protein
MTDSDQKFVAQQRANQAKFEKAVRQMERHVKKKPDGTFELTAKNAREAGVDEEEFKQLRASLERGNEQVRAGKVPGAEVKEKL